jgi:L-lactate dehydrogenase
MRTHALNGRIVIIGTGNVGATIAYTILLNNLTSEIVLIDVNRDKVQGEVLDMNHGLAYFKQVSIREGTYEDCVRADVVVIAAGVARRPGQSRLELAKTNVNIVADITKNIMRYASNPLILVVSNPVDVLTYVVQNESGLSPRRVIGTGTTLDTARFKYLLGRKLKVDVRNIHAYIIGEHGDTVVPVWSHANVAGEPFEEFFEGGSMDFLREDVFAETKASGAEVIKLKSATTYGISMAATRIISCILGNENAVLTVSTVLDGQYGLSDVALSVPVLVGANGVERYLPIKISEEEDKLLKISAKKLKDAIADAYKEV